MRKLLIGQERYTIVEAGDKPGPGGACHEYYISRKDTPDDVVAGEFGHAFFKKVLLAKMI